MLAVLLAFPLAASPARSGQAPPPGLPSRWCARVDGAHPAKNVPGIDVGAEDVTLLVTGEDLHRVPCSAIDTDGSVALRVDHHVNLHVATLEISPA